MRVLVDTSAWVDFLHGFPSPAADALAELLRSDDDACAGAQVLEDVITVEALAIPGMEGGRGFPYKDRARQE